jgi:hypothetical protein
MTPGASEFSDDLASWLAAAVADAGTDDRRRAAWLAEQAAEEATVAGLFVDLAERARPVLVATTDGRSVRGVPIAVGADVVVLDPGDGRAVLVALGAVVWVRPQVGGGAPGLGRATLGTARLAELVAGVAPQRPRVVLRAPGAEAVTGELRRASVHVAEVRLDGDGANVFVSLEALSTVVLDGVG